MGTQMNFNQQIATGMHDCQITGFTCDQRGVSCTLNLNSMDMCDENGADGTVLKGTMHIVENARDGPAKEIARNAKL
eukprot:NODE_3733_length_382_cov_273.249249_g3164_i0.p2 GENE.NODE_3733_length_382_cov_273.249249_g3164_i0~~NODE_3733_length_382_cov_273.249249_g3164_i0.p2  ORF type:complete len:87 (-),score=33.84 NODE_3733_length_382_cov_273.249249_g3164_i0:120-350(-)